MGLLNKIEEVRSKDPCFSTFCKKYGFLHAGIFTLKDNIFILTKAFGLDEETVFKSVSSKDFWEGSLKYNIDNNFWVSFSRREDNLEPFYQFFSRRIIDELNSIYFFVFKTASSINIFFLLNLENDYYLPEISESFSTDLLFFLENDSSIRPSITNFQKYFNSDYIFASVSYTNLLKYYFNTILKTYPEEIQKDLLVTFHEEMYSQLKMIIPHSFVLIPYTKEFTHIIIPKIQNITPSQFEQEIISKFKISDPENFPSVINVKFYEFNQIQKDEFFRSYF